MNLHTAVAEAIKASGFDQMAEDYLSRPADRKRIIAAMTRNIQREFGREKAIKFAYLAHLVN